MSETLSYNPEAEQPAEKERIYTDPVAYWQSFKESDFYHQFEDDRKAFILAHATEDEDKTDEAIREFIEESPDLAKDKFFEFYQSGQKLDYDPKQSVWSLGFRALLQNYWDQIKYIVHERQHGNVSRDRLLDMDEERSSRHMRAAQRLAGDGLAPSEKIAEIMIHMMTVSAGKEGLDPDREEKRRAAIARRSMDTSTAK